MLRVQTTLAALETPRRSRTHGAKWRSGDQAWRAQAWRTPRALRPRSPARRPGKAARAAPHRIKAERHDAADAAWKKDAKKRHPSRMNWRASRSDRLAPALAHPGRPKPTRTLHAKNNAGFACAWRPERALAPWACAWRHGRTPALAVDRPPHNPRPGHARILFDFARKRPCLSLNIEINIQAETRGRPCGGIGLE